MNEEKKQSVALRTYLYLEQTYLSADDESEDETEARAIMDLIWNLLSKEDHAFLDARKLS